MFTFPHFNKTTTKIYFLFLPCCKIFMYNNYKPINIIYFRNYLQPNGEKNFWKNTTNYEAIFALVIAAARAQSNAKKITVCPNTLSVCPVQFEATKPRCVFVPHDKKANENRLNKWTSEWAFTKIAHVRTEHFLANTLNLTTSNYK